MKKIEVKILNPESIDQAEKLMVCAARLTQRGHQISCLDDFMDLYEKPYQRSTVANLVKLPHPTIQKFGIINVVVVGASREEIMEAAKKASIHDFIMTLPKGYDTEVGELGDTLSGGEKQRIGIARAFLHECPLILLDEPTSNLDSLNEGIILKSLKESAKKKTVVLVSHRVSTMNVADVVYEMENGRIS